MHKPEPAAIRLLQPGDSIEELTALLHRAYARLGQMGLNYTSVDQSPEVTAQRIGTDGACYVVEQNGRLVATVLVKPTYTHNECGYYTRAGVAAAHQFAVEPDLQGRGIGHTLLQACETWARERHYRELALDTAEPATHLVNYYTRQGFRLVDHVRWTGKVYRSVVMSKTLV